MLVSEVLTREFRATGWTLDELIKRSGIRCSRPSIYRKIHRQQVVSPKEYDRLARLFGYALKWTGTEFRLAEKAA
jgi:plasmid maintenance system antidote protein VapI